MSMEIAAADITRRTFLKRTIGTGTAMLAAPILASCSRPDSSGQNFDLGYVQELLTNLENASGNAQNRRQAIMDSLFIIVHTTEGKTPSPAFMIDESGYFVSAAHTFGSESGNFHPLKTSAFMYHPQYRVHFLIRNFAIEPENDAAIIYAPTGSPRKKFPNLRLNFGELREGNPLTLVSIRQDRPEDYPQLELQVGRVANSEPNEFPDYKNLVAVRAMIPTGGQSGAPIKNDQEEIAGILTGGYPVGQSNAPYQGALVTPLKNIRELTENPNNVYPLLAPSDRL